MVFSIVARYPLGVYRGQRPDLTPERIPSVARLHAALLAAAGFGPRAIEYDGGWGPCGADDVALRWLEENPPTDVRIPPLRVSSHEALAYRDDGTIKKSGRVKQTRKLPKHTSSVAVDGAFVWSWRESPPAPVAEALRELCPDVPHLGTAESPVLLTISEDEVAHTHEYGADADMFTGGAGVDVDLPVRGRVDELIDAHQAERRGRVGSDRAGTDERSTSPVPPRRAVRVGRYLAKARRNADVPWPEVLLVPLDRRVEERDRVRVAVAAHRALIKILDREAPPVLTGVYPPGVRRPSNRVALQVLDREHPVDLPGRAKAALAVLVPREAAPAELDAIYRAVAALRTLHPGGRSSCRRLAVTGTPEVVAGDRLWREPQPGTVRQWRTSPPAVPDTRGRAGWGFTHAALLSLGFVWQGTPLLTAPTGRGEARDNAFVEAVNAAGAVVLRTTPVRTSRVEDYVHRVHPDAVVRPYHATLALGDLGGSATIQAIGQSRHLGGGLLIPHDRTEGEASEGWPA
ncbi:type I-G CRISPR-associated protein Csb2 [Amycolatopsis taiwanensis]|uniref:type I-G CRISPR-associated protein Csb2 n=1 Tax=Amycolatopsis taiwanensis TaxID=342230 RepID=UPI0004BB4023|nr:type I-U CRISPR-associated protein Csb2 [Amycolatopsis taiwanensis]